MTCDRDHTYRLINANQQAAANGEVSDEEADRREGELFDALEAFEND